MTEFITPDLALGTLDADSVAKVIAAAGDIVLIVGRDGVIEDLASGSEDALPDGFNGWRGRRWTDAVTVESRDKVEALVREAKSSVRSRWRQINHPLSSGPDMPVLYRAVCVGSKGQVVAIGRDMRAVAALQQRLVDAQQSMEREYARLKHAEMRYRLLFQLATEPVLIVDATSGKVAEANPAAGELLGDATKRLAGRALVDLLDPSSTETLKAHLARVRAEGRADDFAVRLPGHDRTFSLSASIFRQESGAHFLIRLAPAPGQSAVAARTGSRSKLLDVIERSPDGFVVTDMNQRILAANRAFLDFAQLTAENQAQGEWLERWLGRTSVDVKVLIENLREHGSVRLFATAIRGEQGMTTDVEVSAVSVPHGEQPCLGFAIRHVGHRLPTDFRARRELPRSVQQMTELVGRVPLRELVREATDVIERLCIEAALELTGDNRASAAEMLGLSRQSLYSKLRRYGMGDLGPEPGA